MRDINSLNNERIYQLKERDKRLDEMDLVKNYRSWVKFCSSPIADMQELKEVFAKIKEEEDFYGADNNKKVIKKDFISRNLGLVISVIGDYVGRGISEEDLIQIGNIGLINAVNTFDPNKGFMFSTYAIKCINNIIINELLLKNNILSISAPKMRKVSKIFRTKNEMMYETGRIPTNLEIAEKLGISVKEVQEAFCIGNGPASFDEIIPDPRNNHSEEGTLYDFVSDDRVDVYEQVETDELKERLDLVLRSILTEKEIYILKSVYEFDGYSNLTYEKLGEKYGVTRQAIEQCLERIIVKLRRSNEFKKFAIYLDDNVDDLNRKLVNYRYEDCKKKLKSNC